MKFESEVNFDYSAADIMMGAIDETEPEVSFDLTDFSKSTTRISLMDQIYLYGCQIMGLLCLIITILAGLPNQIHVLGF